MDYWSTNHIYYQPIELHENMAWTESYHPGLAKYSLEEQIMCNGSENCKKPLTYEESKIIARYIKDYYARTPIVILNQYPSLPINYNFREKEKLKNCEQPSCKQNFNNIFDNIYLY